MSIRERILPREANDDYRGSPVALRIFCFVATMMLVRRLIHFLVGAHGRRAMRNALSLALAVAVFAPAGSDVLAQEELDEILRSGPDSPTEPARDEGEAKPVTPAPAAEAPVNTAARPAPRLIEEIIVTAQKKEESLQDVPISMSVLDGEFLKRENITDLTDVSRFVPNVNLDVNPSVPDANIRGFSAPPINKALEPAVGLVIDGIPYGREPYFQGALYDLDRVEVLRGPQGTLFGKNTTAGLLHVVTRNPTDELTGDVGLEIGELDRRRLSGAVGGPIVPGLVNFRIAALAEERDGFIRNTTADVVAEAPGRLNSRERKAIRLKLGFPDVLGADVIFSYEHLDLSFAGTGWEFSIVPEDLRPFFLQFDPGTDFDPDNRTGSTDYSEEASRKIHTWVANAGTEIGSWGVDAVAGFSILKARRSFDGDFSPAPLSFHDPVDDDNFQTTVELRTTSPNLPGLLGLERLFGLALGSGSNLTAGVFYQRRIIEDSTFAIMLNPPLFVEFMALQNAPATPPVLASPDRETLSTFDEISTMFFEQTADAVAGFAQVDWQILDRWSLLYGMRLSHEGKSADWNRVFTQGEGVLFRAALGQEEFTESLDRSELDFSPKVSVRWDWTDEASFYGAWVQGFRGGGFNDFASSADPTGLEFDTEKATSWEIGTKSRLLGGTANVNATLFRQDVEDLQVFGLDPDLLIVVIENAAEARAQGLELDATWLLTGWLTLIGALGFNDTEFLDFPIGTCLADRENTDGDDDPRCDLTGEPLFRAPKWMTTLTSSVRWPLDAVPGLGRLALPLGDVGLGASLTVEYQDIHFVNAPRDPRVRQPSFFRLGGSVGIASLSRGWSLRFVGENLTDVVTRFRNQQIPSGAGVFSQLAGPPRLFFASFQWSF